MLTDRLEIRPPVEADRGRFVELFADDQFMVFTGGVLNRQRADERFDRMLTNISEQPFAKQPVIEQATGLLLGYSGIAWIEFEGERWPEFGYRLCSAGRGKGYATEAGLALLDLARSCFTGTILAIIDPTNDPSMRVADKLGFRYWKQAPIYGDLCNVYRIELP